MTKQKRISVSFSKEYFSEYDYLVELTNSSDFICRAVREKIMKEKDKPHIFERYIRETIEWVLQEKLLLTDVTTPHEKSNQPNDLDLQNAANHFEL
jgi:metal-responsive CopG/Arc/MetJ family transcriptional regulator